MVENYLNGLTDNKGKIIIQNIEKKVGQHNGKLIREFIVKFKATPNEPGDSRIYTTVIRLKTICDMLDKHLDELVENDLIKLNNIMRDKGMDSSTYYRRTLKQFLKLTDKKKFFDLIDSDYLKSPRKKNSSKKLVDPNDFLTMEQLTNYVEESQHKSKRQGCWAGISLGTGCRPGELLQLTKRQIKYGNNLLKVNVVEGKTGSRLILLEGNEAAGVWFLIAPHLKTLDDNDLLFPFTYEYINKVHKRICNIVGIPEGESQKLYNARKMALTHFYDTLSVVKASAIAGHVQGSNSMKNYVGVSAIQMLDGIPRIEMRECPNPSCLTINDPHRMICKECQSPLDVSAYKELLKTSEDEKVNEVEELREKLIKTDEALAHITKHLLNVNQKA